jgi:magnesium chelatase subunit D
MTILYPFPAVIGQEHAKKALLCALANEDIRSVLILGDPGTGKSMLARSIGSISEGKKVLTMPQNITLDRLMSSIDLETAVSTGMVRLVPGILEQGNCQILYADDINLMDEGIVSNLLNTSEIGDILLEREGFSHHARTRFLLVATMDPAEGDLSAGQMDRFDLCVTLDTVEGSELRAEVIRKHLQFERFPEELTNRRTSISLLRT